MKYDKRTLITNGVDFFNRAQLYARLSSILFVMLAMSSIFVTIATAELDVHFLPAGLTSVMLVLIYNMYSTESSKAERAEKKALSLLAPTKNLLDPARLNKVVHTLSPKLPYRNMLGALAMFALITVMYDGAFVTVLFLITLTAVTIGAGVASYFGLVATCCGMTPRQYFERNLK